MSETRSLYEKRKAIHPKPVNGRSQKQRRTVAGFFYGLFFLFPWLHIDQKPLILIDITHRQAHFFQLVFMPQDVMLIAWFFILATITLFLFTTIAGRLWCGFLCPQTIWTMAFIWVEEKIQGPALSRKKANTGKKTRRFYQQKLFTHCAWLIIAFYTSLSFLGYFYPIYDFIKDIGTFNLSYTALFWLLLFTWLTYVDAGLLREQVCIHMCPYAKFQSVMYDEDTLIVAYDASKGEPRGSLKSSGKGGCIDCSLCVQVCPTGIDIRDGLQIDCINCGLCVDACDQVMESIGRDNDLIGFNTQKQLNGGKLSIIRPKTIAYSLIIILLFSLLSYQVVHRSVWQASIVRERDRIHRFSKQGEISNHYRLKVTNKTNQAQHYRIDMNMTDYRLIKPPTFVVEPFQTVEKELIVMSLPKTVGSYPIEFELTDLQTQTIVERLESRYLSPQITKNN